MKRRKIIPTLFVASVFLLMIVPGALGQAQQQYIVKKGDTLYELARAHNTTVLELQRVNNIEGSKIRIGQKLWLIDPGDEDEGTDDDAARESLEEVLIDDAKAEGGEVEDERDLTLDEVLHAPAEEDDHQIHGMEETKEVGEQGDEDVEQIEDGEAPIATEDEPLRVTVSIDDTLPQADIHIATEGETFYSIAALYGVPVDTLWVLNSQQVQPVKAGDKIKIPLDPNTLTYTVEEGDTVSRLSKWFDIPEEAIRRVNRLGADELTAGQILRIPRGESAYRVTTDEPAIEETGIARIYPERYVGRLMASGLRYDVDRFTISHATLRLGTVVLLTNDRTGANTFAEVTDRPPHNSNYLMDVSNAVAKALELEDENGSTLRLKVVN